MEAVFNSDGSKIIKSSREERVHTVIDFINATTVEDIDRVDQKIALNILCMVRYTFLGLTYSLKRKIQNHHQV